LISPFSVGPFNLPLADTNIKNIIAFGFKMEKYGSSKRAMLFIVNAPFPTRQTFPESLVSQDYPTLISAW